MKTYQKPLLEITSLVSNTAIANDPVPYYTPLGPEIDMSNQWWDDAE